MRTIVAALIAITLLLAGCGSDDEETTAASTSSTTAADTDGGEEHEGEDEGEGRDPDARFGADVCRALLQALEGNTDGLDRYADQDVLDVLSEDPYHGRSDDVQVFSDGGDTCTIEPDGDVWFELTLLGDGHVGQRAVAIETLVSGDAGGGSASVGEAIADHRAANGPCGEDTTTDRDEVLEIDGGTVVALHCESFAYQSIYQLHGYDGSRLVPLVVEQWYEGRVDTGAEILGYPFVENGLLANIEKGRGIGDCGTYQQWTLADDVLSLVAVYHQECEDTDDPKGPEDWPQVYP